METDGTRARPEGEQEEERQPKWRIHRTPEVFVHGAGAGAQFSTPDGSVAGSQTVA